MSENNNEVQEDYSEVNFPEYFCSKLKRINYSIIDLMAL